jgi:hypothetical protein
MLSRCKSSLGHGWQNLRYARDDSGYDYPIFNTTGPICGLMDIVASYTSVQDVCNGPTAPLSPCTDTNDQCTKSACLVHVGRVDRVYIVSYTRAVRSDALTADNDPKFACTRPGYECLAIATNMSATLTVASTDAAASKSASLATLLSSASFKASSTPSLDGTPSSTRSLSSNSAPTAYSAHTPFRKVSAGPIVGGVLGIIALQVLALTLYIRRVRRKRVFSRPIQVL